MHVVDQIDEKILNNDGMPRIYSCNHIRFGINVRYMHVAVAYDHFSAHTDHIISFIMLYL